jgi:hypothetical protein
MEQVLPSGRGEKVGKRYGRISIVKILCTNVCKWKNYTDMQGSSGGEGPCSS